MEIKGRVVDGRVDTFKGREGEDVAMPVLMLTDESENGARLGHMVEFKFARGHTQQMTPEQAQSLRGKIFTFNIVEITAMRSGIRMAGTIQGADQALPKKPEAAEVKK